MTVFEEVAAGRTDRVFDHMAQGLGAQRRAAETLGDNFDLNGAAFHGHWRLCQFLCENGADVNQAQPDTCRQICRGSRR